MRIAICLGFMVAGLLALQVHADAIQPSRISEMAYFVGSWSCKTTKAHNPKYLGHLTRFKIVKQGQSLASTDRDGSSGRIVYNPNMGDFVYAVTSPDGSYGATKSSGWRSGTSKWVEFWTSEPKPSTALVIIKQESPTAYTFSVAPASAQNVPISVQLCTKV